MMRRVPAVQTNTTIHRDRDHAAFGRLLLILAIALICAGGFVVAARQHFLAVKLGYQNEDLRREHAKLTTEQQLLKLAREQAISPARLTVEAQKLGLQPATVKQFEPRTPVRNESRSAPEPTEAAHVVAKKRATPKR